MLDPGLRSRAYRLAAWVALRRLKRTDLAEQHLGTALEIWPYAGRMHAERAAYFLSIGDLDRAATDAQRSVELAQDDAAGYLELGIWAELSGEFEDADQFYRKTLALLPTYDIVRLATRVSIMDPPGRLLTRAAEMLLTAGRPRDALRVAEQALHADQRGPELHPQAAALRVRCRALQEMTDHSPGEAAVAAIEAGKLYAYNGDVRTAIELFERAEELDGGLDDVGWLLADARLTTSLPLGATTTDQTVVARARETWERSADKVGLPGAGSSWAYLTRAEIADLGTQHPEANRLAGIWEALQYVEKAILHDSVDAQRWGYAAQYLRYVHLDELALEAVERGYELSSGERKVLAERLAQLMFRGRFVEADRVAEDLGRMFGNDPWVSAARAWIAIHSDLPTQYRDGLVLLELPIAGGNDPSWYYEMRALCHLGLGEIGLARGAYRDLLSRALAVDGTTKCRRAVAAVAAGDLERAAHWSGEAWRDPTSRPVTCLTTDAFLAFGRGEPDPGVELLGQAVERASSVVELHDVVELTLLRLRLLGDRDALAGMCERVESLATGAVRERERSLASNAMTADQELADALAACEANEDAPLVIRETLLAVTARREAHEAGFARRPRR